MKAARTISDSTRRFSDRVEYYVRSRPKYPPALLHFCRDQLALCPEHVIADIGSGTGLLSELFIQNGNTVMAVEPNAPMRLAGDALLGDNPHFQSIDGTAEATGLPASSVDFVVAGQAFHWFDRPKAKAEFQRILRPGGWVMLVWNARRPEEGGFANAYERVVQEFQIDLKHVAHQGVTSTDSQEMAKFFELTGCSVKKFDNPQLLDLDGVLARAWSSSYLPLPGQPGSDRMEQRLRAAFFEHAVGGKVRQDYDTEVFYGRLV